MNPSTASGAESPTRELVLFDAIADALSRETEVGPLLSRALDALATHVGLETGWVWLLDEGTRHFYLAAARELPPFLQEPVQMTGEVCWCMESFFDGDFASKNVDVIACSRLRGAPSVAQAGGLRHHASVVLRFGSRELGIMNLTGRHWRPLSEHELRVLATIGAQIGLAVERARLAGETINLARSDERARLARDIHDTLAQDLTAISLQLDAALRRLNDKEAAGHVGRALDVTRDALERLRESVAGLRSDPLGGKPLGSALGALARRFTSQSGILVSLSGELLHALPHGVEVELFRIASEALVNIERHAGARRVEIRLQARDGELSM
ncbi:MAG: GAF domain-containing protein, partial [Candidatus Eremiobacteraeota bacterium]|nr:GAF domain-containing protein [Candidatus Eremiobacteraeota bacterium]